VATVRPARVEDGDAIGRIQVETWRAAYAGLLPDDVLAGFDVEARQRMWTEGLARRPRPGSATFVAELDREVIGFATVGATEGDPAVGELYAIYVHPSGWGRGAGRALLDRAEKSLRSSGFPRVLLWVLEGNERAARFYEAAGWVLDGSKRDYFQGAATTQLRYVKTL
jgi:ribosomal protein S18 acetylase RimI-like enzyme